jgi:hypothetical protein
MDSSCRRRDSSPVAAFVAVKFQADTHRKDRVERLIAYGTELIKK